MDNLEHLPFPQTPLPPTTNNHAPYQRLERTLERLFDTDNATYRNYTYKDNIAVCSSGTAALHLALAAIGPFTKPKSVIIPTYTMIACPRAATLAGYNIQLVDCSHNLNIDVDLIDKAITKDTIAIMAVHIYGRRCNMDTIHEIAKRHKLYVIEDMAEIHGVNPHPDTHFACWSFYQNKIIHGEEGGCVRVSDTVNKMGYLNKIKSLRSLGMTPLLATTNLSSSSINPKEPYYLHPYLCQYGGNNYRMSNANASLILESIINFPSEMLRRTWLLDEYERYIPSSWRMPSRFSQWVHDIQIPELKDTQQQLAIVHTLNSYGIQARPGFYPIHLQPEYSHLVPTRHLHSTRPLAESINHKIICLPLDHSTNADTIQKTVRLIKDRMMSL